MKLPSLNNVNNSSRRIHKNSFIPLKICSRINPPSIAIFYKLSTDNNKKYLHEIPLPPFSREDTSNRLYQVITQSEPLYLNPKIIPQKQIIRIIEQIMNRNDTLNKNNNERCNTASTIANSTGGEVFKEKNKMNPLKKELENELKDDDDQYEADFCEESHDKQIEINDPKAEIENQDDGLPEGFQRVFVEDLGEEVMMDQKGNLYDFNGNLIGQAASDDEEEAPAEGGNDDNYFDDVDLP